MEKSERPRDNFCLPLSGKCKGDALHIPADGRVEFCDVDPCFLNGRVFVHDSVNDALTNDLKKLGAYGHFFLGDGVQGDVINSVVEVVRGHGGGEVGPYTDVYLVMGADRGLFLHASVVRVDADAVNVDLV